MSSVSFLGAITQPLLTIIVLEFLISGHAHVSLVTRTSQRRYDIEEPLFISPGRTVGKILPK